MQNTVKSNFYIYSVGAVAEDKPPGVWDINVVPIELITDLNGDISTSKTVTANVESADGDVKKVTLEESNTITASWLQFGSNRMSPPDVCKGETVLIFHYAGTDQYYWIPMFCEPDLRKRESALYYFSNRDDITNTNNMLENGYYLRVDTYDKLVKLHTGTGDGEKAGYDITLDGENGKFTLADNKNNSISIDSTKGHMNFDFKTIAMNNGTDELIAVLLELMESMLTEQHIGNLGAPTSLFPETQQKYQKIKEKLTKFKG